MILLNSERVAMVGNGPVLVAIALSRRAENARVFSLEPARTDTPGHIDADLWRE